MIQFCFRFDWISSYQTDPPVDNKYKLWVKYKKNKYLKILETIQKLTHSDWNRHLEEENGMVCVSWFMAF